MQCHECEIRHKCANKPQLKCVDYKMFASEKPKEIEDIPEDTIKEYAEHGVTFDGDGHMQVSKDFSLGECSFCGRVDNTLVYQHLGKNIYCCNECKEKMTADDDSKTMELIDMIAGIEKFARNEKVNKGLESLICVLYDSVKKGLVGDSKPLLDLFNTVQAVGKKESIRDAIRHNIFNDKELGYLEADINRAKNQLKHEEKLKLTDESEDEE